MNLQERGDFFVMSIECMFIGLFGRKKDFEKVESNGIAEGMKYVSP